VLGIAYKITIKIIGSGLFILSLAYQARDRLRAYFLPSPGSKDYTGLRAEKVPR
jgi:hypothetical protein